MSFYLRDLKHDKSLAGLMAAACFGRSVQTRKRFLPGQSFPGHWL